MKKTIQVVKGFEDLLFAHQLKKSEVCKRAGIQNSIFSYVIKRARDGKSLNEGHVAKIEKAIQELIEEKKTV